MRTWQQPVIALCLFSLGCLSGFAQVSAGTPAKDTAMDCPCRLALDNEGHLYFNQIGGSVRRLDLRTNTISNITGTGKRYKEGIKAREVGLEFSQALAVDPSGNLLVGQDEDVRKIDSHTGLISTVAGTGESGDTIEGVSVLSARFQRITALAFNPEGEMFIADDLQEKVFRVDGKNRKVYRVTGTGKKGFAGDSGPALDASFRFIESIAFDAAGNLIIADTENCRIRRVDHLTGVIDTIAVTGRPEEGCPPPPGTNLRLPGPDVLATDATGDVYFVETAMNIVERLDAELGTLSTVAGTGAYPARFAGDGGLAIAAELNQPSGLVVDSNGNLFVADCGNNRIRRIDARTKIIKTIAGNGLPHIVHTEM